MAHRSVTQDIISVSERMYFEDEVSAPSQPDQALNYFVSLCQLGFGKDDIAVMDIYVPNNVNWDPKLGFPVVQVSKCENSFTQQCVIATNYQWGANVEAVSSISWKIDTTRNTSDYFFRVMAWNAPIEISMEISFTSNINVTSYPWTSDHPFDGPSTNTPPQPMAQYWKSNDVYTVNNEDTVTLQIGYCKQGNAVKQVDIAVAALPDADDYSLMQVWACPKTLPVDQCTLSKAVSGYGWANRKIGSFILIQCPEGNPATTVNGLWVKVKGWGANKDKTNKFTFSASQQ